MTPERPAASVSQWNLRNLAECLLDAPPDSPVNVGLARDLARAALVADGALAELAGTPSPFVNKGAVLAFTKYVIDTATRGRGRGLLPHPGRPA